MCPGCASRALGSCLIFRFRQAQRWWSPTAATQSTEPEAQIDPAEPPFEVRLTAVRSRAKVFRSGGIELEVQQAQIGGCSGG